ncbi:Os03g0207700, partial [Oryza sativa Japonica Group]
PGDPATKQWLEVAGELACHSSVMRLKLLGELNSEPFLWLTTMHI